MARTPNRRRRPNAPAAERLEPRVAMAVTGLTLSASPNVLRPIASNDQPHAVAVQTTLPVTIAGEVTDAAGPPAVSFQVVDSLGRDQPSGPVAVQVVSPGRWFYTDRFGLSILRGGPHHRSARTYTVIVTAADAGGARQAAATVLVPPAGFFPHRHKRG